MLEIESVTLGYGPRTVLREVSLRVAAGEVLALIGPNGAGKSTLVRAASGVLAPVSGKISIGGEDLARLKPRDRARRVAVVPQAARLPEAFTVGDAVLMGRTAYLSPLGGETDRDREIARTAMSRASILELADRRIGELSGGEGELVLIARALAQSAPVLLLDEPTAHLDLRHQSRILGLIRELAREGPRAVLLALHDLNIAGQFADRVALLAGGVLRALGPPSEVITPGVIGAAYGVTVSAFRHPTLGVPVIFPEPSPAESRSPAPPVPPTIPPPDEAAREAARARQDSLTKPPGSLGRLEELSLQLAAITGRALPPVARKAVIVMAADHGVAAEGVSAYPAAVTRQMVLNFLGGGAAINVLAGQAGARVVVVNAGLREPLASGEIAAASAGLRENPLRFVDSPVARGTASMVRGAAMSAGEAESAIELGRRTLREEVERGLDLVATGDMGIGNTTASAALTAALTGAPPRRVTGRGTGIDDAGLERKIAAIEQALAVNRPDPGDPLDALRKVGGLEIAGLVGVILEAAARRIPVVLDGFISGAAALVAAGLAPAVKPFLIAAHLSVETGHRVVLDRLGLRPILDLDLRLGEGTGAALAFQLLEAAVRLQEKMATFSEAGVSGKTEP